MSLFSTAILLRVHFVALACFFGRRPCTIRVSRLHSTTKINCSWYTLFYIVGIGQTRPVNIHYVLARGTLDDVVWRMIKYVLAFNRSFLVLGIIASKWSIEHISILCFLGTLPSSPPTILGVHPSRPCVVFLSHKKQVCITQMAFLENESTSLIRVFFRTTEGKPAGASSFFKILKSAYPRLVWNSVRYVDTEHSLVLCARMELYLSANFTAPGVELRCRERKHVRFKP